MWKIKNIFPQKANKRNWILLGLGALAISLILIFWIIAWSGADEHFLENPTIKNEKQKIVDDKIAEVYAEYSCDFKNETLNFNVEVAQFKLKILPQYVLN